MTRWMALIGLCCVLPATAEAQPEPTASNPNLRQTQRNTSAELTLQIDRDGVRVAEPVTLRVQVEVRKGTSVQSPDFEASLSSWTLVEQSSASDLPATKTGRRVWEWTVVIESYEPGPNTIPALTFALAGADLSAVESGERQLITEPIEINIVSVLQPNDQPTVPRQIKGPADVPSEEASESSSFLIIALLVIAMASALVGVFLYRRSSIDPVTFAEQKVTAIETAYHDHPTAAVESYAQLNTTIRELIQSQWAIPATSATSQELLNWLNERFSEGGPVAESLPLLKEFLETVDQARFAANAHAVGDPHVLFDSARRLIQIFGAPSPDAKPRERA